MLEREHRRTRRVNQPFALLMLDVDHFKACNDHYGHAVGDLVLKAIGRTLAASLRRPGDLACGNGGEEFALILPDTNHAGATVVAAAIHRAVARMRHPAGEGTAAVMDSIGVACAAPGDDPAALFAPADAASYEAKHRGRDHTEFAPPPPARGLSLVA